MRPKDWDALIFMSASVILVILAGTYAIVKTMGAPIIAVNVDLPQKEFTQSLPHTASRQSDYGFKE